MTLLFCERQDCLDAVDGFFDVFWTKIRVLIKICFILGWSTVIVAPSPVESFEIFPFKEESKFIHRDFMLQEGRSQHGARLYGSRHQGLGVSQLGEFWTKGFPELHAGETAGVNVGEAKSKTKCDCSSDDGTKQCSDYWEKLFHDNPTKALLIFLAQVAIGVGLATPIIWLLGKYVFFA